MDPCTVYPTCVLKMDLDCCQACVVGLKKLLKKIDGVKGFDIDSKKGLVTIVGTAPPELLVEKIRQRGKKAKVVPYEKPTQDGNLDSKTKENKKKSFKEENTKTKENKKKSFKEENIICHHDSHEFEDYVPPKPHPLETCKNPYCKLHFKKPVIIRATGDNMSKLMLPPFPIPPQFLPPPPPRFLPPPPGPHYPSSYREDYPEDHQYRLQHIEPIVYDRPLPQYDPWYNQRPPPQYDPWSYQRPQPAIPPPHYGY